MSGIGDRRTFVALRADGLRVRRGVLGLTYVAAADGPARVAYAVSTRVGSAVVRNRVRRRLRALVAEHSRDQGLRPGAYLIGASPAAATSSFAGLAQDLRACLAGLEDRLAGSAR